MEIGSKLKEARMNSKLTQEKVAEEIEVSRQTISNWENEKCYPDIISVIRLSDLYNVSLDNLLKGDADMIRHLEESTNVVTSNRKLMLAVGFNAIMLILFIFFNGLIEGNKVLMIVSIIIGVLSSTTLFYQIIRKF